VFVALVEGLGVYRLVAIATGRKMIRSGNLSFTKRALVEHSWELNTEEMGCLNNIKEFIPYLKRTQHFSFTMINWLMLFKKIIPVCTRYPKIQDGELLIVKRGGKYNFQ
jgi:hypothetical protein